MIWLWTATWSSTFSPKFQCYTKSESACLISIPLVHWVTRQTADSFLDMDTISALIRYQVT